MSESADALLGALAGTHAAVYAYGVAGATLSGAERAEALTAMAAHRRTRDRLLDLVAAGGATPPAAAPAYELPFPVPGPRAARRLAGLVEDRLAGQLAAASAALTGADRSWAARTTQECAVRATAWTGRAAVWAGAT